MAVRSIKAKLTNVPQSTSEECIYRVPKVLREVNEDAYTPRMISIGPFHLDGKGLQFMEVHKSRYLKNVLERTPEKNVEYYVANMERLEEKARLCYNEPINLTSDKFVEMMLVDSCFIIEFMLKACEDERDNNDLILTAALMEGNVVDDLLLIENQLPYFVIEHLFNLIYGPSFSFFDLTLKFFWDNLKMGQVDLIRNTRYKCKHFVDLLRQCYSPSSRTVAPKNKENINFIPTATELHEAGVRFEKSKKRCFLDVSFRRGVISIPSLDINGRTVSAIRNVVAFEHFDKNPSYVTDYVILMDSLLNSHNDAILLQKYGIINNWLGDDSEVPHLFSELGKGTMISSKFHYAALYEDVNAYYREPWHAWRRKLKRDYFNNPWSTIAFSIVTIVLICEIVQAVCSVISVKSSSSSTDLNNL